MDIQIFVGHLNKATESQEAAPSVVSRLLLSLSPDPQFFP